MPIVEMLNTTFDKPLHWSVDNGNDVAVGTVAGHRVDVEALTR